MRDHHARHRAASRQHLDYVSHRGWLLAVTAAFLLTGLSATLVQGQLREGRADDILAPTGPPVVDPAERLKGAVPSPAPATVPPAPKDRRRGEATAKLAAPSGSENAPNSEPSASAGAGSIWIPLVVFMVVTIPAFTFLLVCSLRRRRPKPVPEPVLPSTAVADAVPPPVPPLLPNVDIALPVLPAPTMSSAIATAIIEKPLAGATPLPNLAIAVGPAPVHDLPVRKPDVPMVLPGPLAMPEIPRRDVALPVPCEQPPYFNARAIGTGGKRFYRVYVLPDQLLFITLGENNAQQAAVPFFVMGGLVGGLVAGMMASSAQSRMRQKLASLEDELDRADTAALIRLSTAGRNNFRASPIDLCDLRLERAGFWHKLNHGSEKCAALLRGRHMERGSLTLELLDDDDVRIVREMVLPAFAPIETA